MAENLLANVDRQLGQELRETALDRNRPKLWARRLCMAKALYDENSAPHLVRGSCSAFRSQRQVLSGGSGSVSCGSCVILVPGGGGGGDSHRRLLGPDFGHVKTPESLRLRCAAEESQPSAVDVVAELFSSVHSFAQGAQVFHHSAGPGSDGSNDSAIVRRPSRSVQCVSKESGEDLGSVSEVAPRLLVATSVA